MMSTLVERNSLNRPGTPLAPLVAFLRLDRQGGDWTGVKPPEADRFAGLLAIAVGAVVDPLQRRVDLRDQLALRSRVLSSSERSVSDEARSARSGRT